MKCTSPAAGDADVAAVSLVLKSDSARTMQELRLAGVEGFTCVEVPHQPLSEDMSEERIRHLRGQHCKGSATPSGEASLGAVLVRTES